MDNIDFVGEYYPVLGHRDTTSFTGLEKVNCFIAGIKFTTFGHHFMLTAGNTYDTGIRRLISGSEDNTMYYGFNIHRYFVL